MFQTSGQLTLEEVTVNIVMSAVLGFFIFLSYAFHTEARFTARNSMHLLWF